MKLVGTINGIQVYETADLPPGIAYMIDTNKMYFDYPKRKDGKPDMRYAINKRSRMFGLI
jgi:hypothetical protein